MKHILYLLCLVIFSCYSCKNKSPNKNTDLLIPPVVAPFTGIDTIATNDWWNRKPNKIIDVKVKREDVIAFGIYTVHQNTLKLTAQLFPLYPYETRTVRLEIYRNGRWQEIQKKQIDDIGWSALFRIENWDNSKDVKYRIRHGEQASFEGIIRKNPVEKKEILLAALSCNSNKDRGGRENYVRNINYQDPDLVFFAGDQSYDHSEHTAAWLKFGMQFRDVFRHRPCITIPDDHDIGQGNLWGEGGKKASTRAGDDGGYFFPPEYVKMVEKCQTGHLPDPYDPTPIDQGIGVYYTNLVLGGIDFAIIEDRKFKSGPKGKIPQIGPRPDHIRDPNYDPESVDLEGLKLLGERQLNFLTTWGTQHKDHVKVVLSQTGFCGGAHIHGNITNRLHADMDSNGWPQKGRNKALRAIKAANAIHIAGDQHLATVIQHGIDDFDDGPWAFVVPAIVNNYYSRWWWPENEKSGPNSNGVLPWNGQYLDGFHNKITMHAYVNPDQASEGSGYGLIRFNKENKEVTFECWPRDTDVSIEGAKQFMGFPITIKTDL
ncbi:alkaline phosphatase D family protein [Aestuariivivens sediminis]|uniref:alkaline phosphatase D family protein n=1 Tax=Aestuariivivens sediminis TaxID=2913557 RepID=UPI001F599751|nr:alkaline phosphatase D family protein [Aestuariivivens sediminis]